MLTVQKTHRGGVIIKPWVSTAAAAAVGGRIDHQRDSKEEGRRAYSSRNSIPFPDGNRISPGGGAKNADGLQTVTNPSIHTTLRILFGTRHLPRFDYLC
jgi:hypothetical protein